MTDGKSTKEAVSLKIYESAEDYLEKILMLTERNGEVRSIDIATEMGVTKPSVSIEIAPVIATVLIWQFGLSPIYVVLAGISGGLVYTLWLKNKIKDIKA